MSKWFSQDPRTNEWTQYDGSDSAALEKAFAGDKKPVKLDFCGNIFTVDVKKMVQTNNTGGSRRVKREVAAAPSSKVAAFVKGMTSDSDGVLGLEQLGDFCEALGVDPATEQPFILFYKFGVEGCWEATAQELLNGFASHGLEPEPKSVTTAIAKWKNQLASDYSDFQKFAEFTFKFCRPTTSAKAIAFDDFKEPMSVCLAVHKSFAFGKPTKLVDFFAVKGRAVSFDLWKQSVRFLHEIKTDCSNYSEDDCWNTVLDDFVESIKA